MHILHRHSVYNIFNPNGLKILTNLKFGLSLLNEHRLNHNFENCFNPFCTCSFNVDSKSYHSIQHKTFSKICKVDVNCPNASDEKLVNITLYVNLYLQLTSNLVLTLPIRNKLYKRSKSLNQIHCVGGLYI